MSKDSNSCRQCLCECGSLVAAGRIYRHGHNPSTVEPTVPKEELRDLLLTLSKGQIAEKLGITAKSITRLIRRFSLVNPPYIQSSQTRAARAAAIQRTFRERPRSRTRQLAAILRRNKSNKGKTLEDIYSPDQARRLREESRLAATGRRQSAKTIEKHRQASLGRHLSESARKKLSKSRRAGFRSGAIVLSPRAGCGDGGFRKDIGHYVRSHYEYIFARWLLLHGVKYSYEPTVFDVLVSGVHMTYRPDFLVGDIWVEIKNPFNAKDSIFRAKFRAFVEQYRPAQAVVVVGDSRWGLARDDVSIGSVMETQGELAKIIGLEPKSSMLEVR